jgi:general secretion pathway protein C
MEALIKRHFTLVVLALVALAAFFQASGIGELVGSAISLDETALAAAPSARMDDSLVPTASRQNGQAIRDRNPFDSVKGPLVPERDAGVAPAQLGPQDPLTVPDCQGMRVAIVSESPEPMLSSAAIQAPGAAAVVPYSVGDKVGDLTVVYIGSNPMRHTPAVWLSGSSGLCQAMLFTGAGAAAPPAPGEPAPPPPPAPVAAPPAADAGGPENPPHMQAVDAALAARIRKGSETEAIVPKDALDQVLKEPMALMPDTRIFAEKQNEQVVGIRVFGIRPDTLLGKLGFESGDRFESINGAAVTSPDQARRAFEGLRGGKLEVQVTRRGKPVMLTVRAE